MKGPIRPKQDQENRVLKQRIVGRIYGMTVERAIQTENRHVNRIKRSGQAWLLYIKNINCNISTP